MMEETKNPTPEEEVTEEVSTEEEVETAEAEAEEEMTKEDRKEAKKKAKADKKGDALKEKIAELEDKRQCLKPEQEALLRSFSLWWTTSKEAWQRFLKRRKIPPSLTA